MTGDDRSDVPEDALVESPSWDNIRMTEGTPFG